MKVKDRPITHYFGQSPQSDESTFSLKENEAGSSPVREKTAVNKASSSGILKCKTPGNNVNTEEEHAEILKSDFIDKSDKQKQSGKRKSVSKKKSCAINDEDFKVKITSSATKTRGKQKKNTLPETALPATEPDQSSYKSESTNFNTPITTAKSRLDQTVTSQKEASLVSPIHDDSTPGSKSKSTKNIKHFFSPSKSIAMQPEPSVVTGDENDLLPESSTADCKGECAPDFKDKQKLSKKVALNRTLKKLKEDLETCDLANNPKEGKNKKVDVEQKKVSLLSNNDGDAKDERELTPSKLSNNVKSSVYNAFQKLMSKKQNPQGSTDLNNDPTLNEGFHSTNEDNASLDDTPKQFHKRKKRNRTDSETDEDDMSSQQKKLVTEIDETNNQEESGRKSLMKYFPKISKAEAEIQSQRVQFKVEALVHHSDGSPYKPKPKSKKDTPSQQKNLKKKRVKCVGNENEIEWLGTEEITLENNPATKPGEVIDNPAELDQADDEHWKGETKSTEELVQASTKRNLKLSMSSCSPSGSEQTKKASKTSRIETSRTDSFEGLTQQSEAPVINIPPVDDVKITQPSPTSNNKTSGKKLKQVSLMDSSFLQKPSSNIASQKVAETTKESDIASTQRNPVVQLESLSPSLVPKVKTPLKSQQKKSLKSKSTVHNKVVAPDEESPMNPLPLELPVKSPSPKQSTSHSVTPQARIWKMRVCLTPKSETNKTNSLQVSPNTVDTGSDDDFDVQEIAIVKKKKKKAESTDSVSKELPRKEIEIIHEKKGSSSNSKAALKLAPLFMRPKKCDRISVQAKQEFLQSGVPEQVKKMIEVQKSMECAEVAIFPRISHVTQLGNDLPWTPSEGRLPLKTVSVESNPVPSKPLKMGDMTTCDPVGCEMAELLSNRGASLRRCKRRIAMEHVPTVLSLIRAEDSSFKVLQYFKMLREKYRSVLEPETSTAELSKTRKRSRSTRRSRGSNQGTNSPKPKRNISSLMWTDKYRPTTCDAIIGNKESVQKLKHWLEFLRKTSQSAQIPVSKAKKPRKDDYEDDFVVSDGNCDSNGSSSCPSNSALLLGCHGSGKTNCVYALAADLGYKVLEINASERRSGKIVLANLSEATQSHQVVNRSQEQSAATSLFSPKNSKHKASKRKIEKGRESEEESNQNKHSLILIKDIDVVFEEEDEGFVSAVASLVSTSKRPVIFTTTEKDFPHLKRVINSSTLLLEFIPDKNALCSWLQTIALVEGAYVSRAALSDLMSACRDDVRQCLLQLQVWMATGGNYLVDTTAARDNDSVKVQEKALLEFLQADITEEDLLADVNRSSLTDFEHYDCLGALQGRNDIEHGKEKSYNPVTIPLPVGLGLVWWNLPNFLSLPQVQVSKLVLPEVLEQPRRFKGLFDDSIFDVTSDDEDMSNSQPISSQPTVSQLMSSQPTNSQPSNSAEQCVPSVENASAPLENDPEGVNVERCTQQEMDAMLSHLQAMSTCDLISTASNLPENSDDCEPTPRYWQTSPRDSLSQSIPLREGPNLLVEDISRSMCHWLAEKSIQHARTILQENTQPLRFDAVLPDQQIERRRLDVKDVELSVLQVVAVCAQLERSAIALDYLPTLRRICASEQRRAETNTSRGNRFYHYFKSLGVHLSTEQTIILSST